MLMDKPILTQSSVDEHIQEFTIPINIFPILLYPFQYKNCCCNDRSIRASDRPNYQRGRLLRCACNGLNTDAALAFSLCLLRSRCEVAFCKP